MIYCHVVVIDLFTATATHFEVTNDDISYTMNTVHH